MSRRLALYGGGLVLLVIGAFPLAWMLSTAFKPSGEIFATPPGFSDFTVHGYVADGAKRADEWLLNVRDTCPLDPTVDDLAALAPSFRAACYDRFPLTFDAYAWMIPGEGYGGACGVGMDGVRVDWLQCENINHNWVNASGNTDATFLLKPDFKFDNGYFTGYDETKRSYNKASWGYQMGEDGFVKVDETMQDPLCVYQQLKTHYSRYTPEMVSRITGTPRDRFLKVCEMLGEMSAPTKTSTSLSSKSA